jgi:CelD/BcsL family acetyltransferase involved in cellulose biosynthesis
MRAAPLSRHAIGPIECVDPTAEAGWDHQVEDLPGATFFHGAAWARVLADTYGYKPVYLRQRAGARMTALLPLMDVASWLTGRRGVSVPFADEAAPLCPDQGAFDALYAAAEAEGRRRRWKHLECRGGRPWFGPVQPSISFIGHELDLRAGSEALFAGCSSAARRAVRKAEQARVAIEFSTGIEGVRAFHALLGPTRRRHGVPPQPWAFFAQIHRHVIAPGQGFTVLARSGSTPIAGAMFFHFGKSALFKFGASDDRFQELRPNNLVMWSALRHFADRGFHRLDLGRTAPTNAGLRQFKRSWGTREYPIEYVRRALPRGRYLTTRDRAAGWPTRAMAALPLPLFKFVGSLLYQHLA